MTTLRNYLLDHPRLHDHDSYYLELVARLYVEATVEYLETLGKPDVVLQRYHFETEPVPSFTFSLVRESSDEDRPSSGVVFNDVGLVRYLVEVHPVQLNTLYQMAKNGVPLAKLYRSAVLATRETPLMSTFSSLLAAMKLEDIEEVARHQEMFERLIPNKPSSPPPPALLN